jgi:hypothetical protein
MISMEDLVTDCILEQAFAWLRARCKEYPDTADCWRLRQRWPEERSRLTAELLAGTYDPTFAQNSGVSIFEKCL